MGSRDGAQFPLGLVPRVPTHICSHLYKANWSASGQFRMFLKMEIITQLKCVIISAFRRTNTYKLADKAIKGCVHIKKRHLELFFNDLRVCITGYVK